jgi:hypothetical protein
MLDTLSEMLALSSYGNTKNIIITGVETLGELDLQALQRGTQQAAAKFPQMQSCIEEVRENRLFRLVRRHRPDLEVPVVVYDVSDRPASMSGLESYLDRAAPRLDRDWDLFREVPAEIHVVKLGTNHHILGPVIHHAAADGGVASEFGREFLAQYHRIMTGEPPEWENAQPAISTSSKRRVKRKQSSWRDFFSEARGAIAQLFETPSIPGGNGSVQDLRQYHVKRVLSVDETERAGRLSAAKGASLVDLLTTAANYTIDRWNCDRGIPTGLLTTSMSVNMRGRFKGMDTPNTSALLFFRFLPHERADRAELMRSIGLARIRQFRSQMDLKFHKDVSRMTTAIRLLPFHLRRRIVHSLMERHQYSAAVTLLGVIWPTYREGKPTADSGLTSTGNLTISEVHGLGYKLLSSTPLVFIVYFYRNRLNLTLAASARLLTREEAEQFMNLFVDHLLWDPMDA